MTFHYSWNNRFLSLSFVERFSEWPKMDFAVKTLTIFSYFSALFRAGNAFLDIDELKSVNYGVDILSEPVVLKPEVSTLPK